jgi:hypothetical protein
MDEKVMGCLGTGEQTTDYRLCSWDSDLLPPLVKKDEIRFSYNQYKNKRSRTSCTIFAAVGMMSDLMNYEFSYDEIHEIDELSYERWRIRWEWWWVQSAVKLVADWWNERHPDKQVAYYRISKYEDDIMENCLDKLYALDWNLHFTDEFYKDREDWMIDWTDFWHLTNWHSICITKKDWQRSVKDSWSIPYYWLKNKLSKITNFGSNFYIYVPVGDRLEEIKRLNEMKTECLNCIESLWNIWNLTNEKNFREILHYTANKLRDKIKTCNEMLVELWE